MTISRVLITGGTGFVGTWMQLTKPKDVNMSWINRAFYNKVNGWELGRWDAIVHLAPISPARVLEYAKKHSSRVLFASSGAVYERTGDYSYHKRMWEAECRASDADTVIARLFCFVGEYLQLDRYSIGQFIQDGISGGPVRYYDIGCIRSYMYGEDLGRWMWKLLMDGTGAYDVGSSKAVSMKQVAEMVASACNCNSIANLPVESDKPKIYMPFTARAQVELGLSETVTLEDAIRRTVAWNRERIK
jgi:nucleoside-diphosphate-sugar epimerase